MLGDWGNDYISCSLSLNHPDFIDNVVMFVLVTNTNKNKSSDASRVK